MTLFFEGHIDSSNASAAETEILASMADISHKHAVINAENPKYISSAGLRIILKVRRSEPDLKIINGSPEGYDILDMTGFTEMPTGEKAYRRFSVDGCEMLGEGSNGVVYWESWAKRSSYVCWDLFLGTFCIRVYALIFF